MSDMPETALLIPFQKRYQNQNVCVKSVQNMLLLLLVISTVEMFPRKSSSIYNYNQQRTGEDYVGINHIQQGHNQRNSDHAISYSTQNGNGIIGYSAQNPAKDPSSSDWRYQKDGTEYSSDIYGVSYDSPKSSKSNSKEATSSSHKKSSYQTSSSDYGVPVYQGYHGGFAGGPQFAQAPPLQYFGPAIAYGRNVV